MSASEKQSWIRWFCGLPGNEFFCEVEKFYITDGYNFNLHGLNKKVPHYTYALDMILDVETHSGSNKDKKPPEFLIKVSAEMLYGLIHARYILTDQGIDQMVEKYKLGHFGHCPRTFCEGQDVLPIGMSDLLGESMVQLYCPKCMDVFTPPESSNQHQTDGAYFGTGFPHMLFMVHPEYRPQRPSYEFCPRMFGIEIHPQAHQLQRQAGSRFEASMRMNHNGGKS